MSHLRVLDAKLAVHESVRGGRCKDDPDVIKAINEAIKLLLDEGDWKDTVRTLKLCAYNGFAHLPRGVEAILKVDIYGKPADVWHKAWEFVEPGVGDIDHLTTSYDMGILEAGDHATFWPFLKQGMNVGALSTEEADSLLTMDIYGAKDPYGEQVRGAAGPSGEGEVLQIGRWQGGVQGEIDLSLLTPKLSSFIYKDVASIRKPVTQGYITLFGYDPVTQNMQFLAKYHPNEIDPTFRWYRIPGANTNCAVELKMLVKIKHVTLAFDDEVLPIQNMLAIEMAVKSVSEKKYGSFQLGLAYQADAIRLLSKEKKNADRSQRVLDVRVEGGYATLADINEV